MIVRLIWILMVNIEPVSDAAWYFDTGTALSKGLGYTAGGAPTAYWPIGYPAFLGGLFALTIPAPWTAELANVFCQIAAMAVFYKLTLKWFNSETIARLTLLILAFYPNHIAYCAIISSESLFTLALACSILLLQSSIRPAVKMPLAGLAFGLTCLCKPQALFIPGVIFLAMLPGYKRKLDIARLIPGFAILYICLLAVVLPWSWRNYKTFNRFVLVSTNGGINLLIGNNEGATGKYEWSEETNRELGHVADYDESVRNQIAGKIAVKYIKTHPLKTLRLVSTKLYYLYFTDTEAFGYIQNSINPQSRAGKAFFFWIRAFGRLFYYLLGILALGFIFIAPWRRDWKKNSYTWAGLGIIIYFSILHAVFFGSPRFHFPLIPFIIAYAAAFTCNVCSCAMEYLDN